MEQQARAETLLCLREPSAGPQPKWHCRDMTDLYEVGFIKTSLSVRGIP